MWKILRVIRIPYIYMNSKLERWRQGLKRGAMIKGRGLVWLLEVMLRIDYRRPPLFFQQQPRRGDTPVPVLSLQSGTSLLRCRENLLWAAGT